MNNTTDLIDEILSGPILDSVQPVATYKADYFEGCFYSIQSCLNMSELNMLTDKVKTWPFTPDEKMELVRQIAAKRIALEQEGYKNN